MVTLFTQEAIAAQFESDFRDTVLLAEKLGAGHGRHVLGLPGRLRAGDRTPNWVTCPWPEDFLRILDYQWNQVLIPYWKEQVKFAQAAHGVKKIAFEMHPGFCVYNPETPAASCETLWAR